MTDFTFKTTNRGFGLIEFVDHGGDPCTLQESSEMHEEGVLRFGAKDLHVQYIEMDGWKDLDFRAILPNAQILGNQRMDLTQSQLRDLLPILTHFARVGVLPEGPLPAPVEVSEGLLPCPFCGGTLEDGTLSFAHVDKYVSHAESDYCAAFRGVLIRVKEWNHRAPAEAVSVPEVKEDDSQTLLPCPFCGDKAEQRHPDQPHGGMVNCRACGAEAFGPKWNRRALSAGDVSGLKKAHAALVDYEGEVDENVLFEGNEGSVIANARLKIEDLIEEAKA